MTIRWF